MNVALTHGNTLSSPLIEPMSFRSAQISKSLAAILRAGSSTVMVFNDQQGSSLAGHISTLDNSSFYSPRHLTTICRMSSSTELRKFARVEAP